MNQAKTVVVHSAILGSLLLFWATHCKAQVRSLDISQYTHASWKAEDGHFRGDVGSVSQTSDGNLWLTSSAGLLRFDGVRFVAVKPPTMDSFPGNPLQSVFGSKNGSLWIGGAGLAEMTSTGQFRRYHELDKLGVEALAEDKDGGIWAGGDPVHGSPPLCRVYGGRVNCYGDSRSMGSVKALHLDKQGRIWAATGYGVWRVYPGAPQMVAADDSLTSREVEVLQLIASGKANKSVAGDLSITEETVKGHVKNILSKLGARDRTHAVTIALKRGIIVI